MKSSMTDLTRLPDLVHDAARAGAVRSRRPVYLDLVRYDLAQRDPAEAERLMALAGQEVLQRWATYEEMATRGAARSPADARPASPSG